MPKNTTEKGTKLRGADDRAERNRIYGEKMRKRDTPATMTVADMVKDEEVPLHVRLWLEQFMAKGKSALTHSYVEQDYHTLAQARLIRDVLNSEYKETGDGSKSGDLQFSDEATDYVQEYLYRLAKQSRLALWNFSGAAVAALPVLLECSANGMDGTPELVALESAIFALTTQDERRNFFTGDRYKAETVQERAREAGFKLARLLANPKTPFETRRELGDALLAVTNEANISVDHPALARRALELSLEVLAATGRRARSAEAKADRQRQRLFRDQLFALLDGLDG